MYEKPYKYEFWNFTICKNIHLGGINTLYFCCFNTIYMHFTPISPPPNHKLTSEH